MQIRRKEYVKPLGGTGRRRLRLLIEGKRVIQYLVQLEVETASDEWKPCVRYDNEHGFPHRDQLKKKGEEKKTFVHTTFDILTGYRDAVSQAEHDIEKNWKTYRDRFLEGEWPIK